MLFSRVFATHKSWPALPAPLPFTLSSRSSLFFSEACALFSVTAVSQPFVYQSLRHSFHRDGGSHPSSQELCAIFASCCSPLPVIKSLRTIDLQKPIKTKDFNLFQNDRLTKNRGVGGVMVNQTCYEACLSRASIGKPRDISQLPPACRRGGSSVPMFQRAYNPPLFSIASALGSVAAPRTASTPTRSSRLGLGFFFPLSTFNCRLSTPSPVTGLPTCSDGQVTLTQFCSLLYSFPARRVRKWYGYGCLSSSAHQALAQSALAQSTKQIAGEHMELTATQQERPWDRPFWKPVHGKEGVFTYLVLIHVL